MLKIAVAVILAALAQASPQKPLSQTPSPQTPVAAAAANNADEAFVLQRLRTSIRFENDGTSRRETRAGSATVARAGLAHPRAAPAHVGGRARGAIRDGHGQTGAGADAPIGRTRVAVVARGVGGGDDAARDRIASARQAGPGA